MVLCAAICDDVAKFELRYQMNSTAQKQATSEQKLPTQRTVRLVILGMAIVITLRMIFAAIEHNQWREFIVSEVAVVVSSMVLWFLLRDSKV